MSETTPLYALLVGIDEYASETIDDLQGCVNDVRAVEQLLRDRFQVPADHIRTLTNHEATHEAIRQAFQEHLIERARAGADAGEPRAFLFHYSGHGSRALDETGTEPDGMDETIVPHDSRQAGVYDIKDWELGEMIEALAEHSDNVTIVLDCCHSGSGTRAFEPTTVRTRRTTPDLRPQPSQRPAAPGGTRGLGTPSGWELDGRYVLLAGCRDQEEANEHVVSEGDTTRHHGAMTYFLVRELAAMPADRPLVYGELHERVRLQVNRLYEDQMPQCEGDRGREVFGGLRPQRAAFLTVVDKRGGYLWVDGGMAHGLTEGSQLHVYPPETRTLEGAGEPIATLRVEEVGAVQSGCTVEAGEQNVPLHARAVIHRLNHGQMQKRVVLDLPTGNTLDALRARLTDADVAPYVRVVEATQPAPFRVVQVADALEIQDASGKLLVAPFAPDEVAALVQDLVHLVRYQNVLELENSAPHAELKGAIQLDVKKLDFDPDTQKPVAVPFERPPGGELIVETGERVVIELTNRSDVPLYVALFDLSYDWSISLMYPEMEGAHEPLRPGGTLSLGLSRKRREQIGPLLPPEVPEARQILKAIATVQETDFEILTMGKLKTPFESRRLRSAGPASALDALLEQAMQGGNERALGAPPARVEDEWTTTQMEFQLMQPVDSETGSRHLRGGEATTLPGYQIKMEPPDGFTGQVRVLTERQSTRAAGGDPTDLRPPPGLAGFGEQFERVGVRAPGEGTRSAGPVGSVIEVEADEAARQRVTAETPLKLRLPVDMIDDNAPLMVIAYDGNFFYPAGRPGEEADALDVEWLPPPAPPDETPVRSTRSLGRTVKLYLYKTFKWVEPSLGLHHARFVPDERLGESPPDADERSVPVKGGEVRYRDLRPGELQSGQRVALLVHGFNSDTQGLVRELVPWLESEGVTYDHVLTFDYETFGTSVSDNGRTLATALRDAGFDAEDDLRLDVFAHSMGTLVTRAMIELWGGDRFVDRAILAGPPNLGTRLAEGKRLVTWLGTLLLNQAGPTPPTLLTSWALKKVSADGAGMEDLRPGSAVLQQLNDADRAATVPYFVLAGRNEIPAEERGPWQRLVAWLEQSVDVGLDTLFGDQNDLIISVGSMKGVRNGNYPADLLRAEVVPCNHFEYFATPEPQQHLRAWLT